MYRLLDRLQLQCSLSACYDFAREGRTEKKTVVLAPIRLSMEDDHIVVAWACSRGEVCEDLACKYAKRRYRPYITPSEPEIVGGSG